MKSSKKKEEDKKKKEVKKVFSGMPVINPHAAGIDAGDTEHYVAYQNASGEFIVDSYATFTGDLNQLVNDFKDAGVTTVAIESTGVYWVTVYLLLEQAGIEMYLVNAKHTKNVTGRKKDDTDAMWIQKLHSCGLLQKSFQPDEHFRVLRDYVRQRKNIIKISSDSVRRMQKSLELMNIKLHTVISDLLGKTGMDMIKAILKGERDVEKLADLTDPRIKASREEIIKSLQGIWVDSSLFMLEQAYDDYIFHQRQMQACEQRIEKELLKQVAMVNDGDISMLNEKFKKKGKKNQYSFPLRTYLKGLLGVDLCEIPGINEVTALEVVSEIGIDMSKFETSKRFSAWCNVVPNTKISGGKVLSSRTMKKKNHAGQSLRMAASSLWHDDSPYGNQYRKMKAKYGGKGAVFAMAHVYAKTIFTMIKEKKSFTFEPLIKSQKEQREGKIKQLEKQIERLRKAA